MDKKLVTPETIARGTCSYQRVSLLNWTL